MGIIKTAMMTGGGLYAIKKLAKAVETRETTTLTKSSQQQPMERVP
jgi:hypothetical protein